MASSGSREKDPAPIMSETMLTATEVHTVAFPLQRYTFRLKRQMSKTRDNMLAKDTSEPSLGRERGVCPD